MTTTVTRQQADIAKLEATRQDVFEDIEHLRAELRSMAEPSADEADVDAFEREKTWALLQGLQRKIESLDRAILSAQRGTYGICDGCGQRIDPARLEILPETTHCLDCQRKFERQNRRRR